MRARRRVGALALALLFLAPLAGEAVADHGGRPIGSFSRCNRPVTPPRCTSVGDDLAHHVSFDETLTEGLASSLRDTMAEDYGPTKLSMIVDPEVTDATDVIAFSEDYGENGAAGWVACPLDAPQGTNASGHRWCRGQELFLNLNPRYAVFFADDASRDHVACHELGHTLGLRHWGNPPQSSGPAAATCMNANTPDGPTGLHQVDIDHINAYGYTTIPTPQMKQWWYSLVVADAGQRATLSALSAGSLVEATEIEHTGSLSALTGSADAVVRARIISVEAGRVFGGRTGHPLHYASATLAVDEVLAGALPPSDAERLTLEIPLFAGPEAIDVLRAGGLDAIFFLRNKGESARAAGISARDEAIEAEFYRLVNFGAVVANESGMAVTTEGPAAIQELAGLPFGEVVDRVRDAR